MKAFQEKFLNGLGLISSLVLIISQGKKFSEKYVVAHFDPFVSRHDVMGYDEYNEVEISFLVSQVSSKFRRIMMPMVYAENINSNYLSTARIPFAVAKYNQQMNPSEPPMELFMSFIAPPISSSSYFQFPSIKLKAEETNELFPRTVKYIMADLMLAAYDQGQLNLALEDLNKSRSLLNNSDELKLGAIVPHYFCPPGEGSLNFSWKNLLSIITHIDFLMFDFEPRDQDVNDGWLAAKTYPDRFDNCTSYLAEKGATLEVGFKTGWPDTSTHGVQNTSNLVFFWELVTGWAEERNITVLLNQAFDTPTNFDKKYYTTGWMRLVENSTYSSALDYKFEEKKDVIDSPKENNTKWLEALFPNDEGPFFNDTNCIVGFNPYASNQTISGYDSAYKKQDILPLVRLASQEFSKMLVELVPFPELDYMTWYIPEAVGQLKKEGTLPATLELVLVLSCTACDKQGHDEIDFDRYIIRPAHFANREYPETVKSLLIHYDQVKDDTVEKILWDLETLRKDTEDMTGSRSLKFGILVNMEVCGRQRTYLEPSMRSIVANIDVLLLSITPSATDLELGVEASLGGYLRWFRFCKEKVLKINPKVQVGLMVAWPDKDERPVQNVGRLVEFWGKVRNWTKESSTPVIFNEAFDIPFRGKSTLSTRGWWRLLPTDSRNTSDFKFEDKKSVFIRELGGQEEHQGPPAGETEKIRERISMAIIIPTVGVALVALVGFVGVVIHMRYVRRRKADLLTNEEMDDFFNGNGTSLLLFSKVGNYHTPAYKTELECGKEEFSVDEEKLLGSGEFGVVFRAKLGRHGVESEVAAKTTKPSSCGTSAAALKGILSEIRILGYLGKHENIVSIVGAYTAELCKGKVYAFTEFCQLGPLKDYLGKLGPTFGSITTSFVSPITTMVADNAGYVDLEFDESEEEKMGSVAAARHTEMMKWAKEICCGMEFLAQKHVVHADLATRNVLLTASKVAKITDFGLSRRLYAYESYVKKQKEALLWRWMSPECLRHLEFNEKTDVWAYGVTLWEIFSCGQVPYAGHSFGPDFVERLEAGIRLQKPRCDLVNLYQVMLKCWDSDKTRRPPFAEIQMQLKHIK